MSTADLLFELGCEELPAQGLGELAEALRRGVLEALAKRGLDLPPTALEALYTPRRLALLGSDLPAALPDQPIERRGPAVAAGLDAEGRPTRALQGFAQSCGTTVERLERLRTDKGEWFVHRTVQAGAALAQVLPEVIEQTLAALPIAKPMRWGAASVSFMRPVHWVVLLLGTEVVPGTVLGLPTGRTTRGHRFHAPEPVALAQPREYVDVLARAKVRVRVAERIEVVRQQSEALAAALGGRIDPPPALLAEVANLTEWPVPLLCRIPDEYMRLPAEVIVTTIETHQRYFPIRNADGQLLPAFIGVANLESRDPEQVRAGFERVVRPRLADAAFFYDQDVKQPLAELQPLLESVTFQAKLGSLAEKSRRVAELAVYLAELLGLEAKIAERAALLSKCDLMTRIVGEFPELQGRMGRQYALLQGEHPGVAQALDEVYAPRQAGAPIAQSPLGQVLAIAERADTLAGIFAIGQKPTGAKDPFGLRRAALGLARTLIEGELALDLPALLERALILIPPQSTGDYLSKLAAVALPEAWFGDLTDRLYAPAVEELYGFILERLRAYYEDRGIPGEVFEAVAARRPRDLHDFDRRVRAVLAFKALPEYGQLVAAHKRIRNILRKAEQEGIRTAADLELGVDPERFEVEAERAIYAALEAAREDTAPLFQRRAYVEALTRLAALQAPVDAYFEQVMVMVEDHAVRHNRLQTLQHVAELFMNVADVSLLSA